jgi:hypothetical protein
MTYPLRRTNERPGRLENLYKALQNRCGAIALVAGKDPRDVGITTALIFFELSLEQSKLIPPCVDRQREMRNWRAGKKEYGPPIAPDWAAKLVRKASRRMGVQTPRHSEAKSIEASTSIAYADLTLVEKRAVDVAIGNRRAARRTPDDRAIKLAKAVRREWLRPVPPFREAQATALSIEAIVRIALPHLDALANGPIRGGTPDNDDDPATMEPPGLGALVAIARMTHPRAGWEYICDVIRKCRKPDTSASN